MRCMGWINQMLLEIIALLHAFAHGKSGIKIRRARGQGPRKLKKKEKHKF